MASTNFLTVKTHLSEFKNNSDRDTMSEASESGTSNSVTSAEDLQKLAVILGLNSAEDVYQERFRVDRRRLEGMLADPHVRVAGRLDDVKLAREKIMQVLDTRGGLTIKRVMEETGCHIHFPDSNRTSTMEKSNQVSIAGDMERVERARARVRALTPLVFCFELPIVAPSQPLPDINSPYVQQVQEKYNVQVMVRNRPKLHANLLVVKGVQWEVQATMEATELLMKYMCGPLASQTQVQMSVEISAMHHGVVVGRGAEQLKAIVRATRAQIMFPDADDPNIPALRKSCVTITGGMKDVYAARQQLVGSLPLVVIFDVSEEACRIENDMAAKLMQKYNVYISIRRKPKQGIASVVIKGIERCAGDIYDARRELLGGNEPPVTAEIPESYNIPAMPAGAINFGAFNPFSPSNGSAASPCSPFLDLGFSSGLLGAPLSPASPPPFPTLSPHAPPHAACPPHAARPPPATRPLDDPLAPAACTDTLPRATKQRPAYVQEPARFMESDVRKRRNGWHAAAGGGAAVLPANDGRWQACGDGSNMVSPSVSPISKAHSPANSADNDRSHQGQFVAVRRQQRGFADRVAHQQGAQPRALRRQRPLPPSNVASPSVSHISKAHSPANSADNDRSHQGQFVVVQRQQRGFADRVAHQQGAQPRELRRQRPLPSRSVCCSTTAATWLRRSCRPSARRTAPRPPQTTTAHTKVSLLQYDGSNVASPSVSPISKAHSPAPSADNDRSHQGQFVAVRRQQRGFAERVTHQQGAQPRALRRQRPLPPRSVCCSTTAATSLRRACHPSARRTAPRPPQTTTAPTKVSLLQYDGSNVASPSVSPISKAHSPAPSADNDRSHQELVSLISELPLSARRAVGCEKKTLQTLGKLSPLADYRKQRAEADKAMRENVGSGYRIPTGRWSGYYFSHTSPVPISLNENEGSTTPEKGWNSSELVRPNIVETLASPPQATKKPCRYQQLYDLLRDIGLQKYIELQKQANAFKSNGTPSERKLINSPPQYNTATLSQDKW
ncbi:unnamed protein product [Parnassius apollo]|uniref:(apollo) hypothetical protein n=1 Tax=Parnassius apollo TaxID=110799 RepID=A0A8S3X270_PARAO|nr:unnamed protein product [Parnassius apollo]